MHVIYKNIIILILVLLASTSIAELTKDKQMIREKVLNYISKNSVKPGETVEFGWFVFKATGEGDKASDVETLDFNKMASFTKNFDRVEEISSSQVNALKKQKLEPKWSNVLEFATVSKSYTPSLKSAFMSRQESAETKDSGWYIGVQDESLDINDPENLRRMSLYEISISDQRFLPYWLFPEGYTVLFEDDSLTIQPPDVGR